MEALLDPAAERRIKSPPRAGPSGLRLTPDDLEAYLDDSFLEMIRRFIER